MGLQTIDAKLLSKMFLAGAKDLEAHKEWINELNVFPVPDGDTGTNMTMTIMSAAKDVATLGEEPDMASLCKAISSGSLKGARGNSGVILSQLLRGFTKTVKEAEFIDISLIVAAMEKGVETAYRAVMKPKEGTILTVAKGMSEKAVDLLEDGCEDMESFLLQVLEHGEYVLSQTPEMLPVLKQAGVVDSGGQGLIQVVKGAIDAYQGKEVNLSVSEEAPAEEDKEQQNAPAFLYAVSFKVLLSKGMMPKTVTDFTNYLNSIGVDLKLNATEEAMTLSVHTNDPGLVLQKALKHGELVDVIIRNLKEEKEEVCEKKAEEPAKPAEPPKAFGFIAVSAGEGLSEIFTSLGVDYIIEGGQTMNPSTADILAAVDQVNAETIFVLPNNKNIIMAANQAAELVTEKTLLVIPTKTIPQGITAVINFVPELSADENEATMMEEIKKVKTGQITYAVRDTVIDDKEIKKDDFMGIGDSGILAVGTNRKEVMLSMIAEMVDENSELISIYSGADITEEEAEEIRAAVEEAQPSCDIDLQVGGQPVYYFVVSVE